jgi:hypothetical protein
MRVQMMEHGNFEDKGFERGGILPEDLEKPFPESGAQVL